MPLTTQNLRAMMVGPERIGRTMRALPTPAALADLFAAHPAALAAIADTVAHSSMARLAFEADAALPKNPAPVDVGAALIVFVVAHADDAQALERLGLEGPRLTAELLRLDALPRTAPDPSARAALAERALQLAPPRLEREIAAALALDGVGTHAVGARAGTALDGLDAARAVSRVEGPAPNAISGAALARALTYGNLDVVTSLTASVKAAPDGALARALGVEPRDFFRTGATDETVVAARLAATLHRSGSIGGALTALAARVGASDGRPLAVLAARLSASSTPSSTPTNWRGLADLAAALRNLLAPGEAKSVVDALVRNDEIIPVDIGAVRAVLDELPPDHFRGQGLLAAQHLLPTSVALYEGLIEKGMSPADMHLLGTPYGTNPLVVEYLRMLGVRIHDHVDRGGDTWWSDEQRKQAFAGFLDSALDATIDVPPERGFLVLDDGGLLIGAVAGKKDPAYGAALPPEMLKTWRALFSGHGVEQTRRGITEIKAHGTPIPVVDVPQAKGKGEEGKVIGMALVDSLDEQLRQAGAVQNDKPKPLVCVVGGGVTGERTAAQLRLAGYPVCVVERDEDKARHLRAEGFDVVATLREGAEHAGVVLGCTGTTSLDARELAGFRGIIASGSSMAVEGNSAQLELYNVDATALNELRPVNFTGDGRENLTKDEIGPTRGLLLIALAQRVESTADLVPLDEKLEDIMLAAAPKPAPRALAAEQAIARPDLVSRRATHAEWMTFLASRRAPVAPPPSTTLQSPGVYFFEDDGVVRAVDTRQGTSVPVNLARVPDEATWLGDSGASCACVVDGTLCRVQGARVTHIADGMERTFVEDFFATEPAGERARAVVARTATGVVVIDRSGAVHRHDLAGVPVDARPLWLNDGEIAFVRRGSPHPVQTLALASPPSSTSSSPRSSAAALSAALAQFSDIEGVTSQVFAGRRVPVVIGKLVGGDVGVLAGSELLHLPTGASVMGIRVAPDRAHVVVSYVLPDEIVDASTYHEQMVAWPAGRG